MITHPDTPRRDDDLRRDSRSAPTAQDALEAAPIEQERRGPGTDPLRTDGFCLGLP
jgi:hypothetical protein